MPVESDNIAVSACRASPAARDVKPIQVELLAKSIEQVGLIQPIVVRRADAGYEVIAGMHRLSAFRLLGRDEIPAIIRSDDDLHAELALIDENLIRNELSPAERALAISRRKAIYEALHPDTGHGGDRKSSRQVGDLIEPEREPDDATRFTKATAESTGRSERAVQRDAQRGEVLGAETLKAVTGTSLDKGEELDALTKVAPEHRGQLIERAQNGEDVSAKAYLGGAASRAVNARRHEPDDSLDYFPTPPHGTRALIERVLPHLGVRNLSSAWEPACGEGHIAEVLREYCPNVRATDIFDYGYGDVLDFLGADSPSCDVDWIITNPPFNLALDFVMRARAIAKRGVAMFVRSQWAVEGIERYETLFRDNPPTLCAFFVERIPLCKGRWDPEVSSAMAYTWVIWMHGEAPRPPLWIPPGCKTLLKPDDVERFTAQPVIKKTTGEITESPATDGSSESVSHPEPVPQASPEAIPSGTGSLSSDDQLDIPTKLLRGHSDCKFKDASA